MSEQFFDCVLLVGLGGTGSFLAEPLVRILRYHEKTKDAPPDIIFADADNLEDSNLVRQLFPQDAVGLNKAEYQARRLAYLLPLAAYTDEYLDKLGTKKLLMKYKRPLVICCVDNHASRLAILEALTEMRCDFVWLSPGNGLNRGQAWLLARQEGQLYGRDPRKTNPEFAKPLDSIPRRGGCMLNAVSTPQLITANMMAAAVTASLIQNLLDGGNVHSDVEFSVAELKMLSTPLTAA